MDERCRVSWRGKVFYYGCDLPTNRRHNLNPRNSIKFDSQQYSRWSQDANHGVDSIDGFYQLRQRKFHSFYN